MPSLEWGIIRTPKTSGSRGPNWARMRQKWKKGNCYFLGRKEIGNKQDSFQLSMQLEPEKKGRRLHLLGVPALPKRKKVVAKKVKCNPCIDHTSQLPLPEFGNQDEAEDANLVKPLERKAEAKAGCLSWSG